MAHKRKKRKWHKETRILRAPAAAPGTLIADPNAHKSICHVFAIGPDSVLERNTFVAQEVRDCIGKFPLIWVNVDGLADLGLIKSIGEVFGVHKLALEDIVHVHQRAKVEAYGDNLFIVARMVDPGEPIQTDQLAMFVGRSFVLTFQEIHGDCFDDFRNLLRTGRCHIKFNSPGHLAYILFDAVVDHYFPVLEKIGELIEDLESDVLARPDRSQINRLYGIKRDLITLRRALFPLREAVGQLVRDVHPVISEETRIHLRDTYDHMVLIIDLLEAYRETASGLLDVYLSSVSNRMNEIMKVLTIISTIFIPLGFVAGVYGMNFKTDVSWWNMPELSWAWGYPFALGIMSLIAFAELYFFWRRGWLGALAPTGGDWRKREEQRAKDERAMGEDVRL